MPSSNCPRPSASSLLPRARGWFRLAVSGLALLAAPQLFAAPACVERAVAERTGQAVGEAHIIENAAPPIYIDLGTQAEVGDLLRFEIQIDGAVSLTETVELTAAPSAEAEAEAEAVSTWTAPVVELLATQPARLEAIRRAAERGRVDVSVSAGDSILGSWSLGDLEAHSAALNKAGAARPFDLRSTITTAGAARQTKGSCENACADRQDDCYYYQCGQFGSASCYDLCDDDYNDCLEGCGVCQPSSTSSTSTTLVSTTPTNTVVCARFFRSFATGHQRVYNQRFKETTTTTTTHADCSQTTSTSVSYYNTTCRQWIDYNTCFWTIIANPAANC